MEWTINDAKSDRAAITPNKSASIGQLSCLGRDVGGIQLVLGAIPNGANKMVWCFLSLSEDRKTVCRLTYSRCGARRE